MIKNHIVYSDFSDWRFKVSQAEGSFLWDEKGKKYLDFTSGWNVANLGWNHPEIAEAIEKQVRKNVHHLLWTSGEVQEKYAQKLTDALPEGLDTVCRATGGTEANEEALKIARAATGRKKIVGFRDSYHGQSFATLAIGYRPEYVKNIAPLVPDFVQLDYPDTYRTDQSKKEVFNNFLDNLERILSKGEVAALVAEAGIITGWGSMLVAPQGFLKAVRKLTKNYGTLLLLDEVGTGFSRLGKLFGFQLEEVEPDIITLAKGISNGAAPIGAVVSSSDLIEPTIPQTNLTSTFGWTPIACAAALKTLTIHQRDKVWERAAKNGQYLLEKLKEKLLDHPKVGDIRGIGMEIGIDLVKDKKTKEKDPEFVKRVVDKAFKNGLHVVCDHESVVQLMPPLTISQETLDEGIDILVSSVRIT